MAVRIISGVVGAAVLLALLALPQPIPPILVILAGLFAAYEFIILTRAKWGFVVGGLLLSALLYAPVYALRRGFLGDISTEATVMTSTVIALLALQLALAIALINGVRRGRPISQDWTILWGLPLAIVVPFWLLVFYAGFPRPLGAGLLVVILAIAWAADTGAFTCGKLFGKRKLIPKVSPGKTWEGYFGGCFAASAVMAVVGLLAPSTFGDMIMIPRVLIGGSVGATVLWSAALGFVFATLALTGDLAFSAVKRARGVKESGTFLPAHGGILDRIDGLLFVACWYFLLSIIL